MTTLSNAQRSIVRSAITAHPDWKEYRIARGIDSASLTSARCKMVADDLGIDIDGVLNGTAAVAPVAPAGLFGGAAPAAAAPAPAAPAPADDTSAALAAVQQSIAALGAAIAAQPAPAADLSALDDTLSAIDARLSDLEARRPALMVVDQSGAALGATIPETRHPLFDDLLTAVTARDVAGRHLNVWLSGPTGSGKTHAATQVAEALGLTFTFHGAMTMAHDLLGFVDAGGNYHETAFVRQFRNGGVCLLDELDAGGDEALLAVNAALSNGMVSLPNGEIVERHADFVCIGAGNTFGQGANATYVGRAKLDAAFLSRFSVKLDWGYDVDLEQAISGNADWAQEVQAARAAAAEAGIKVIIDPRHSQAGAALLATGMKRDRVAELTYLAGITPEQVKMIKRGMKAALSVAAE